MNSEYLTKSSPIKVPCIILQNFPSVKSKIISIIKLFFCFSMLNCSKSFTNCYNRTKLTLIFINQSHYCATKFCISSFCCFPWALPQLECNLLLGQSLLLCIYFRILSYQHSILYSQKHIELSRHKIK